MYVLSEVDTSGLPIRAAVFPSVESAKSELDRIARSLGYRDDVVTVEHGVVYARLMVNDKRHEVRAFCITLATGFTNYTGS